MYRPNDNPLKNVKVEMPKLCEEKGHYLNLIVWGMCLKCGRTMGWQMENENVWERAEKIKKLA